MNYFLSSDYHLGHYNIIKYCNRPFKTLEQMDKTIIDNHNSRIKKDDIFIHVGDFSLYSANQRGNGNLIKGSDYLVKLNGIPILTCLTPNHKVYVKNKGFLFYWELKIGDKILSVYKKRRKKLYLRFNKIKNIQIYDYQGDIYKTHSSIAKMEVTPDHYIFENKKFSGCNSSLTYDKAQHLYKKILFLPKSGELKEKKYNQYTDNEIKLLAWIVSEGSYCKSGGIQIYQNYEKYYKRLYNLLKKLNISFSVYNGKKKNNKVFYIFVKDSKKIRKILPIKLNISLLIKKFSARQLRIFLYEYILGDGHKGSKKYFSIYTANKLLSEQLAYCGIINGFRTYIYYRKRKMNNKFFNSYEIQYYKSYSGTIQSNQHSKSKYKGVVFDLITEDGNFLIEHKGTIYFTGNCGNHGDKSSKIQSLILTGGNLQIKVTHKPIHANPSYPLNLVGHVHNCFKIISFKEYYNRCKKDLQRTDLPEKYLNSIKQFVNKWKNHPKDSVIFNVGVDCNKFQPWELSEIINEYYSWKKNQKERIYG